MLLRGEREGVWREKGREWREEGERAGEMRGKSVKKRREKALGSPPGRAHAPFSLVPAPQAPPRAPGSAWVRRHQFWPEPAKNGLLGARLGPFFGAGAAKSPGEGLLGARLEMPLSSQCMILALIGLARHASPTLGQSSVARPLAALIACMSH